MNAVDVVQVTTVVSNYHTVTVITAQKIVLMSAVVMLF
jgi:hypothetical protein